MGYDRAVIFVPVQAGEAETIQVFDAGRFEPAEIDDVVHVAEQVLVAPLNGPVEEDAKLVGGDVVVHGVSLNSATGSVNWLLRNYKTAVDIGQHEYIWTA